MGFSEAVVAGIVTTFIGGVLVRLWDRGALDLPWRSIAGAVFPLSSSKRTVLTSTGDGLSRAGVRHVVFRHKTIALLMTTCEPGELKQTALEIGRSAAGDLYRNVRGRRFRRKRIGGDELLNLLSHWDTTGGWGQYETLSESPNEWTIKVANAFAERDGAGQGFWEGYFQGFCQACADLLVEDHLADPKIVDNVSCTFLGSNTVTCTVTWQQRQEDAA